METLAPTLRAKDQEIHKLRADVAELVKAMDAIVEHYHDGDDTGGYLIARAMSNKHRA